MTFGSSRTYEDTFFDFGDNPLDPVLTSLEPLRLITDDTGSKLLSFVPHSQF